MGNNQLIKLTMSLPVILLLLYVIPFLGFVLLLIKMIINNKSKNTTLVMVFVWNVLVFLPWVLDKFNVIDEASNIVSNDIYQYLLEGNTYVLGSGIICGLLAILYQRLANSIMSKSIKYIKDKMAEDEARDYKIKSENDMKIRQQKEVVNNTRLAECKSCGAEVLVSSKDVICPYCRQPLG